MKALLTMTLTATAMFGLLPVVPAGAAGSSAACDFSVVVDLSPGLGARPASGTFASRGGARGRIHCIGSDDGQAFTGSGTASASGDFGTGPLTRGRGDDCLLGSGRIRLEAELPYLGLGEIEGGNRTEPLRADLAYARVGATMTLQGSGDDVASADGVATWTPSGSAACAVWVGDARSFRIEGRLLLDDIGPGASPRPDASRDFGPEAARCDRELTGTRGADRLRGTTASELIRGLQGADRLDGRGDGDCLLGGSGNDRVSGGSGPDAVTGGPGRDRLIGGSGDDALAARDGERDVVDCGAGYDRADVDRLDSVRSCEVVRRSSYAS